jgi:hypothetical protein
MHTQFQVCRRETSFLTKKEVSYHWSVLSDYQTELLWKCVAKGNEKLFLQGFSWHYLHSKALMQVCQQMIADISPQPQDPSLC